MSSRGVTPPAAKLSPAARLSRDGVGHHRIREGRIERTHEKGSAPPPAASRGPQSFPTRKRGFIMRDASTRDLLPMAGPRPEKKRQEVPEQPAEQQVLPMQLQIGDRLVDETGTWEVASRPYKTTNAGKDAHIRIKKVGQPDVTEIRIWGEHERVRVKRTTAEDGKRVIEKRG